MVLHVSAKVHNSYYCGDAGTGNPISTFSCGNIVDKSVGSEVTYCFLLEELQIAVIVVIATIFNNIG
jgi:hypothetical protein